MITILHGTDALASQNKLYELKSLARGKEQIDLNGKSLTIAELTLALETQSLFDDSRLVIIENFLSGRPSKEKEKIIQYILLENYSADIIFRDSDEVSGVVLRKFIKHKILNFKPSYNIFKLVDNIQPQNGITLVKLLHELLKTEPAEIIFTMIVRQVRLLIMAKDNPEKNLGSLPYWQLHKFKAQANNFEMENLISLHRKLLDMEFKIKSGQTPYGLSHSLDIFLLNI